MKCSNIAAGNSRRCCSPSVRPTCLLPQISRENASNLPRLLALVSGRTGREGATKFRGEMITHPTRLTPTRRFMGNAGTFLSRPLPAAALLQWPNFQGSSVTWDALCRESTNTRVSHLDCQPFSTPTTRILKQQLISGQIGTAGTWSVIIARWVLRKIRIKGHFPVANIRGNWQRSALGLDYEHLPKLQVPCCREEEYRAPGDMDRLDQTREF